MAFQSITRRITLTAVTVTMTIVLILGLVSFHAMRSTMRQQINAYLNFEGRLVQARLQSLLNNINHEVEILSQNLIFVNALIDSEGRDFYILPFLKSYQLPEGIPFVLTLCDFEGNPIDSSMDPMPSYVENGISGTLIEEERPLAQVREVNPERHILLIAHPVFYGATGRAEGMLIMEIPLEYVMNLVLAPALIQQETPLSKATIAARWGYSGTDHMHTFDAATEQDLHGYTRRTWPLKLNAPMDTLALRFILLEDTASAMRPLRTLSIVYALAGLGVLLLTYFVFKKRAQALTAPLEALTRYANTVSFEEEGVALGVGAEIHSEDEVGLLAEAFNTMVLRLKESHETLEEKVRERTARLALSSFTLEAAGDALYLMSPDGRFRMVNANACLALGYERQELLRLAVYDIDPDYQPEAWAEHWEALKHAGQLVFESRHKRRDGTIFPVEVTASYFRHEDEEFNVAFARDITERRQAEESLRRALSEKEILLREIHHRVKNNLAIISALLNLQSRQSRDENLKIILKESQGRINAMARVHEKLYRTEDFSHIDFKDYAGDLMDHLIASYRTTGAEIARRLEGSSLPLPLDMLVPCGLILNELITNSLKHALRSGESPFDIHVRTETHEGDIVIEYSDGGPGIPPDVAFPDAPSLGLQLIHLLSIQLKGSVHLHRGPGAKFTIRLPLRESLKTAAPDAE